jgi:uncharacterized membrane protein
VTYSDFRFATTHGEETRWFLQRNCSMSVRQMGFLFATLCGVSLGIGLLFWSQGATLVLPFAAVEILAIGLAFYVYTRHARDGEKILLNGSDLIVEVENGGKRERVKFLSHWVRVEPRTDNRSLIEVSGQGRSIDVGRFVRPELRPQLAREIRKALRGI